MTDDARCARRCSRARARWSPFFFLAPYLQMLITALTPNDELYQIPAQLPALAPRAVATSSTSGRRRRCGATCAAASSSPASRRFSCWSWPCRRPTTRRATATAAGSPSCCSCWSPRCSRRPRSSSASTASSSPSATSSRGRRQHLSSRSSSSMPRSTWPSRPGSWWRTSRPIPVELEEAAAIDGATRLGVLRRVTLPLALPGIVTATIFTFIAAWNEFVVALTLAQSPDIHPLTVGVTTFIGQYRVEWQYLFASSLIAIVPVVILFIVIEKLARRRAHGRQHQVSALSASTGPPTLPEDARVPERGHVRFARRPHRRRGRALAGRPADAQPADRRRHRSRLARRGDPAALDARRLAPARPRAPARRPPPDVVPLDAAAAGRVPGRDARRCRRRAARPAHDEGRHRAHLGARGHDVARHRQRL